MRIFLDTNVLASSIATRGLCNELFERILDEHVPLISHLVASELERVLSGKFHLPDALVRDYLGLLKVDCEIVESSAVRAIPVKDRNDAALLTCAIDGRADIFVTGDKELLDLRQVEGLLIVSPRQLWLRLADLDQRGKKGR